MQENSIMIEKISVMLAQTELLVKGHLSRIVNLLSDFKKLNFPSDKLVKEKAPFNIILASSDLYYRENYHSDIIYYIFNHKKEYLYSYIEYLNSIYENKIDKGNYRNPAISKEDSEGDTRIDILITDEESKHCIIVENKINNAGDTIRQLPRYYCRLRGKYKVDAIVYLSMDGSKTPDKTTWKAEDHKLGLDDIILCCAASNGKIDDLVNGFLKKCLLDTKQVDEESFFRQYIELLQFLRRNQMNYKLMEEFYSQMKEPENYSTALSFRTMLNDLMVFRRDKIHECFMKNYKPFLQPPAKWPFNGILLEQIPEITQGNVRLGIIAEEKQTVIKFYVHNPVISYDLIGVILGAIGLEADFTKFQDNDYTKDFLFPKQEDEMYAYVKEFLKVVGENIEKIKDSIGTKNTV